MDIGSLRTLPAADQALKDIRELGLERHVIELAAYGFTVIPPEKTRASDGFVERRSVRPMRAHQELELRIHSDWPGRTASASRPHSERPASSELPCPEALGGHPRCVIRTGQLRLGN